MATFTTKNANKNYSVSVKTKTSKSTITNGLWDVVNLNRHDQCNKNGKHKWRACGV